MCTHIIYMNTCTCICSVSAYTKGFFSENTLFRVSTSLISLNLSFSASIFGLSLILTSYAFLVIGVIVKKYTLLIPYFTLCMFLILILIMKLFIDVSRLRSYALHFVPFFQVISTANTKDTLEPAQLQLILVQVAWLTESGA